MTLVPLDRNDLSQIVRLQEALNDIVNPLATNKQDLHAEVALFDSNGNEMGTLEWQAPPAYTAPQYPKPTDPPPPRGEYVYKP